MIKSQPRAMTRQFPFACRRSHLMQQLLEFVIGEAREGIGGHTESARAYAAGRKVPLRGRHSAVPAEEPSLGLVRAVVRP